MDATTLIPAIYPGELRITSADVNGALPMINVPVQLDLLTDIHEVNNGLPSSFDLAQNYPNPFNATTSIILALPKAAHVEICLYDILGRKVSTLVSADYQAGYHNLTIDGSDISSGIYFYKLIAGDYSEIKQMTLLK
jgi:hypothetical protein